MSTAEAESVVPDTEREELEARLAAFVGRSYGAGLAARDPVNQPMIRHLTDALGDENPVYADEEFAAGSIFGGIVAPPTSLQVWTMQGLAGRAAAAEPGDTQTDLMALFEDAGYVGVVATNCEQVYHRPLRLGDLLAATSHIESISGRKQTGLGIGYFVTTVATYRDQHGEPVGEMRFRILKFRPGTGTAAPAKAAEESSTAPGVPAGFPPPPRDAAYFWDGLAAGELRIQRCTECGTLRHPPRPACPSCHSLGRDYVTAAGTGEVYSYVVHHHPPVPGRDHPFPVAVIELSEGVRMVGNVFGVPPDQVRIGLPVQVVFTPRADGRILPQWEVR